MSAISQDEVKRHTKENDIWLINSNKVYDISDFIERHPGGKGIILRYAGQDVSSLMSTGPHAHSRAAYRILDKYYVGQIHKSQHTPNSTTDTAYSNKKEGVTETIHDWQDDDLVDWNKPILWQVGSLGERYMDWVHSPVDKHIRLFYSDFVEYFSKTPWYVVPIVWLPVMLMFFYLSYQSFEQEGPVLWLPSVWGGVTLSAWHMPIMFLVGMVMWSLLEYILHRWLFHLTPPAKSPFLVTMHFLLHGQHHKAPFDTHRLVFPVVPAGIFGVLFWLLYTSAFPKPMALCMLAGSSMGYVCYDLTHYYLHHGVPLLSYFRRLKRYHIRHHFDDQQKGFGISSKLWDYPFGTLIPDIPKKKKVPTATLR